MTVRIGIDTGGTFTDFVKLGPDGLTVTKLRSTPDDPSRAILEGVAALAGTDAPQVAHGSTVATNAVLERKGARIAVLTTSGFEDVLRIGRQTRPELYNIFVPLPRPLVDPALTFGVTERLDATGAVITPVDVNHVSALADRIRSAADIAAVCFLHAYANPEHERQAVERLRAAGVPASASHEVLPEYREYERWSTTVVNAYVTPLIDRYLGTLESALSARSAGAAPEPAARRARSRRGGQRATSLRIMQSNGGSISAAAARSHAVRTILSGPAAGVVGARTVARAAGFARVVSFDMGGTSTDVSLIDDRISMTTDSTVGDFPVRLPMIDIHTVGAGGGSIAAIDTGGALRVGPRSAGSVPGPVCYGDGTEITVTDANLLLGRLDPDAFLGGRMRLDVDRTRRIAGDLARRLSVSIPALAEGVIRVANANMERAIRVVSVERGHDPRAFALVAFGGAGGMHACEIALRLEIATVVIPRFAGVLSALGMLAADATKDYAASVRLDASRVTPSVLRARFDPLLRQARRDLAGEGFADARQRIDTFVDVRYTGQSYELTIPFTAGYRRDFDRAHERRYGYADPSRPVELVNVRVAAHGITDKPRLPFTRVRSNVAAPRIATRAGRFDGRNTRVALHRWRDLQPGMHGQGPAVITSDEATAVIPPRFVFRIDGFGNVIASRPSQSRRRGARR